jgi:hypothetical protein
MDFGLRIALVLAWSMGKVNEWCFKPFPLPILFLADTTLFVTHPLDQFTKLGGKPSFLVFPRTLTGLDRQSGCSLQLNQLKSVPLSDINRAIRTLAKAPSTKDKVAYPKPSETDRAIRIFSNEEGMIP